MIPEPHICCVCKKEVVMTDCLPAICYRCVEKDREKKRLAQVSPDLTVAMAKAILKPTDHLDSEGAFNE